MRFVTQTMLCALIMLQPGLPAFGQRGPSHPAHQPVPWQRYCQPDDGFCFKYPGGWKMLGEVFNATGVVVAQPHNEEQSLWDEVTVAMVAPPPEEGQQPLGLSGVIDQAAEGMRAAGQSFQTLQRQERTVDGKPAQMLKARYREKSTGRDWIEELVFIEGPDSEIYSVALKCAPQNEARLAPIFAEIVRSWTLPEPQAPAPDADKPEQAAPSGKAPPAH
jgi:hypothetical protein